MAPSIKYSLCGLVLLLPSSVGAQPHASSTPNIPIISGRVTPDQFTALPTSRVLATCTDMRCTALKSLLSSYDTLRRFDTPNSMARTSANPAPTRRPRLPVQDLLGSKPFLRRAVTNDLTVIARNVPVWSTELLIIEIATLIDPTGKTARSVAHFVPETPQLAGLRQTARERCEANHERACDQISDGA